LHYSYHFFYNSYVHAKIIITKICINERILPVMKYFVSFFLALLLCNFAIYSKQNVTLIQGINDKKRMTIDLGVLSPSSYSFHFLLPSIGRKSIFRMLDSLEPQLEPQDFVTIVFDAKDVHTTFEDVKKRVESFPCTAQVIFEEKNLGHWGHGIRNKYAHILEGDFVMHCDDDDIYLPHTIEKIRKICLDPTKLYIFKTNYHGRIWWRRPVIRFLNIATPCGVIPNAYNGLGNWKPRRGGDADFYKDVSKRIKPQDTIFVDLIIYKNLR